MSDKSSPERLIHRLRDQQAQAKLVGIAPSFVRAIARCPAIAKSDATVLIEGETGTGKELVARALHYMSARAAYPFVAVNCGALPDTLLEDELFGHERGAFTDAHLRRHGLLAQGEKGTLLLDEVDTMTPRAQVVLLRFLQDKRFRPVGGSEEQQADVRILAATNAPLQRLAHERTFRADLYYRLSVFSVELPPLRERREDIPLLVHHFLMKHTPIGSTPASLTREACDALMRHAWQGNVRELENAIIRGIHISGGRREISIHDLDLNVPAEVRTDGPVAAASSQRSYKSLKREAIESFERPYLTQLMIEHHGNVSRAARTAGKERSDLGKLLKKYRIDPQLFRPGSASGQPCGCKTSPPGE
jgi:DNA-binding NtrC family response regulator